MVSYKPMAAKYILFDDKKCECVIFAKVNCKEETSEEMSERLDNGYSRSKWVAEQLVLAALRKGLPTTIYRLGKFDMVLFVDR